MMVREKSEQTERIVFPMTRIENDNLVFVGDVILFVQCQQFVSSDVGIHGADAINEDIGTAVVVLNIHVSHDMLMEIVNEAFGMCVACQCGHGGIGIRLLLLQLIFQHRAVHDLPCLEVVAKLLEEIQTQDIHIVSGTDKVVLKLHYLCPDIIFILGRILIDEEIIENIPILWILEARVV